MSNDLTYHLNKIPGKTYMSRRVIVNDPFDGQQSLRIASKVFDSKEDFLYAKEKEEIVIRKTEGGRKEIVAKFFEDPRGVSVVTIQSFNPKKGTPHHTYFSFIGDEIGKVIDFFHDVFDYQFSDASNINITDEELKNIILSQPQAINLVRDNQNIFSEILKNEITNEDIIALGYRKKQLQAFEKLLTDSEYFEYVKHQKNCDSKEAVWQKFFEKNKWIFGYGLNYIFVTGFDGKKLEQVVEGSDFLHKGKRADALMMSKGLISSLCFVEIKTHETKLLDSTCYRAGCWAASKELIGAISQIQGTVSIASKNIYDQIKPITKDGDPTGETVFNFKPKAFLVIGSLGEFVTEHGVNIEKFRSFELFRNSIHEIEIITFDELFERTRFIVKSNHS